MVGGFGDGFGEGIQRGFALDDAVMFRTMMLDIYGNRCAITGGALSPAAQDGLEVFLFQPLSHGGAMTPGNALVVDLAVASLLDRGEVLIGDDYTAYIPHPELIDPALGAIVQVRRPLTLPENVSLWPDRSLLAYRRSLYDAH